VRLIGADGQPLGVVPTQRALALAQSEGFDLIEIAPQATPPVCQIGDYGKYRYKQQQREKEAKKKQKTINWKEVRVAPKIDEHDLDTKIRTAIRLLDHGDKLKVVVRFRGRELAHPDRGRTLLMQMADRLKDHGVVERPPLLEGRQMVMVMNAVRRDATGAVKPAEGPPATGSAGTQGPPGPGGAPKPVPSTPAGPRPAPAPAAGSAAPTAPRPSPAAAATPGPAAPRPVPASRPATAPSAAPRPAAPRPAATRAPRAS
jgi:translation initiation factor IF-3